MAAKKISKAGGKTGAPDVIRVRGARAHNLKNVSVGTELNIVQEGIPDVIPAEACCLGWQESLTLLTLLVQAEIPG